ncbi:MAG: carboxypeptidase regulatory-like domain-containing protein [Acidobacteriaceae bacterium]|nr:carboxypeptidase regulatory-like domain-containing protein [Acidobacteriaceae bacterium]
MRFLVRLTLFTLIALTCFAQEGSITGSVRDASGAVIPKATVTVTNSEQGFSRTAITNDSGDYLVPGLVAGTYSIDVKAQGFRQFQVKDLVLRVAEKARTDATLTVGQTSAEITVAGTDVAQIQTESAELSGILTTKQIDQLVLNGRNFTQLITLIPGVSNQTGQDEGRVGVYGNVNFSVNGGRTEYNNWELDGGDNMDNGSNATLNSYPNVDAIAEVKVLTSNYGAQYGRNGSATIETVTKSGTRDFHGNLFEYLRNEDFNARNYFQSTRPEYKKHDFGYTIGGPVFIPKLYNTSRQKTFFFFSEEWRKELVPGQTFNQQVPSNEERSGNFSDVCPGANCPVNPATGTYFPNYTLPVTPQAQTLLELIPASTTGSGANSFFNAAPAQKTNFREELVRVDQNFTDKQRFFYRFIHDSWNTVTPTPLWGTGSFPTVGTSFVGPGVSMVANLTSTVSPTLLNEFVFSYTTDHISLNAIGPVQRPSSFNMPGIYNNGFRGLLPNVTITNTAEYGGGFTAGTGYFPWTNSNPTYTYKDNLTKIIGTHNLLFGALFIAAQKNEDNSNFTDAQGSLTFSGTNTAVSTGNGFADFLLGRISSFDQTTQILKYYNRYKILEPYIQDDWHVTKKLTLNLGLRISLFGTYREKYKQAYAWQASAYNPNAISLDVNGNVVGNPFSGLVQCGASGVPAGCLQGHLFNPAPRVGFAYDPTGDGKTSIRGGYGIFFEHTNGNEANTESLEGSPPLVQNTTVYNIPSYTGITSAGTGTSGPLNVFSIPTKAIWPYVQQWNFSVQQTLPSHTLLTVAYAGSKGTHLTDQRDINQIYPLTAALNPYLPGQGISANDCGTLSVNGNPVTGQALNNLNVACGNTSPYFYRPYQGFGGITLLETQANSSYNALQVSARRNIGRLQASLAYTWGHSIDDSSDRGDSTFVNSYDLRATRASSNFDQRHLLNISYVYDLPFFTAPGVLHTILGAWQWSGLITYQTGTPFTVVNGTYGDNAGVGNTVGSGSYADLVGNPHLSTAGPASVAAGPLLYNPAAFAQPTGLTFGTSGRNLLTNPARTNFDMGLFKRFPLRNEARAFEFRAEAFNVFNHTQWIGLNATGSGSSSASYTAACTGVCTDDGTFLRPTAAHNPRILQLSLKLFF